MFRSLFIAISLGIVAVYSIETHANEVRGRVEVPDLCSPSVSPAVVYLEREDAEPNRSESQNAAPTAASSAQSASANPTSSAASLTLVEHQKGLRFSPRVQAMIVGQKLKFTNEDPETHNVHLQAPGVTFNESMSPGRTIEFTANKPGVIRVLCDVHNHMRAYLVVSASPWASVCDAKGAFRLDNVPSGRYRLHVWQEAAKPYIIDDINVGEAATVDVGTIALEAIAVAVKPGEPAAIKPWPEVIDRIGVLVSASLVAAKSGDSSLARKLAEDAYWDRFEGSGMEIAIRDHLGFERAGELEKSFRAVALAVRTPRTDPQFDQTFQKRSSDLMLMLHRTGEELNRKGIVDAAHLTIAHTDQSEVAVAEARADRPARLRALRGAFDDVAREANMGRGDEASSLLTDAYFDSFEPLERTLAAYAPIDVARLEARFNTLRGQIHAGLKGSTLESELDKLHGDIRAAGDRMDARSATAGVFGSAFLASLITILREGVEVILLLTMLIALVSKTGEKGAMRAIGWGVFAALIASGLTAFALNRFVASAQGWARERLEGGVMLAAAAVLFYVSYWLIAQSESKRWTDFLKRSAHRGASVGGYLTLALTSFLAVYREGAETALMYQALIVQTPKLGRFGVAAGLAVGLVLLTGVYFAIKSASVKLPIRLFFKITSFTLFVMAVVFAGKGVAELQAARLIRTTPIAALGDGVPILGFYPTAQGIEVQGLLLFGALAALAVAIGTRASADSTATTRPKPPAKTPRAEVPA